MADITLLIDGSHVDRFKSKLGRLIDLERLIAHFAADGRTVSAIYYRDTRDSAEQARQARFFGWLERHGIERRGSDDFEEPWYVRDRYGSNLVALATDATIAAEAGADLVFLAGDAKLMPLLESLERMDVPVTLISSRKVPDSIAPPPPLIELAEKFIDLAEEDRFFLPEDDRKRSGSDRSLRPQASSGTAGKSGANTLNRLPMRLVAAAVEPWEESYHRTVTIRQD